MTQMEAAPGHDTGIIATTPGLAHNTQVPHTGVIAFNPVATHHINPTTDHPHTEVPHPTTLEIKVDLTHVHPTNHPGEMCTSCTPADHKANHITRGTSG